MNPTVILLSTKIDDSVIDRFDPETKSNESVSGDYDQFRLPYLQELRPPSEFYYDTAVSRLVSLRVGDENGGHFSFNTPGHLNVINSPTHEGDASHQGDVLRLAGWINLESRVTV